MSFYYYVYVFLLLGIFSSVYSFCIVPNGTLRLPCLRFFLFFLSYKANARVQLAKTGHGPHSSQIKCVVLCIVCVDCVVLCIVCV
jgi:hypothetical protein